MRGTPLRAKTPEEQAADAVSLLTTLSEQRTRIAALEEERHAIVQDMRNCHERHQAAEAALRELTTLYNSADRSTWDDAIDRARALCANTASDGVKTAEPPVWHCPDCALPFDTKRPHCGSAAHYRNDEVRR